MKIAALNKSFRLPFGETLRLANLMGFDSLQLALEGEFDVDSMSREKTAVVSKMLCEYGINICSYCGDLGGNGFTDAELNKYKVSKTLRMVDYAHNTGVPMITTHIGNIPTDRLSKVYAAIQSAVKTVGEYAAKCGITVAVEAGCASPRVLTEFIDLMPTSIGVNINPANLALSMDIDPAKAVDVLGKRIAHVNATDGKQLYPAAASPICGELGAVYERSSFKECAVGKGDVDWMNFLAALNRAGYKGAITVECNQCNDPLTTISDGKSFLSEKLTKL